MDKLHKTDDPTFPTVYDGTNAVYGINGGFGGEVVKSVVESVVQSVLVKEEEL